jgi:hypothetical protein
VYFGGVHSEMMVGRFSILLLLLLIGCNRVETIPFVLTKNEPLWGRVVDSAGAVIPNVQVELWKGKTKVAISVSDYEGRYHLQPLHTASEYTIKVSRKAGWCEPLLADGSKPGSRNIVVKYCGPATP